MIFFNNYSHNFRLIAMIAYKIFSFVSANLGWEFVPSFFFCRKCSCPHRLHVARRHIGMWLGLLSNNVLGRAMKYGHIKLMVCTCVWCVLDISMIHVWHAVLYVLFKKYYFLARTHIRHNWIWLRHCSDAHWIRLDTARIWSEHNLVLFFSIIWWIKNEFKGPKIQVYLGILFEMSIKIVPYIF